MDAFAAAALLAAFTASALFLVAVPPSPAVSKKVVDREPQASAPESLPLIGPPKDWHR